MKLKLLPKFVLSLGVLGVALTVTISLFSYLFFKRVSGRDVMLRESSVGAKAWQLCMI